MRCYVPKRYIVTCMTFFGCFNAYCMRVNVSVAIVAMVNHTDSAYLNDSHQETECSALMDDSNPVQENLKGELYNWDSTQQGFILSSFFYGYFAFTLVGGYVAEKFGAVRVFGVSILSTSLLTLITSVVVRWGLMPFLALRFLVGIGEGATFPAAIAIISRWSPKRELSRMTTIIFTGATLGNVFSFPVSGYLSSSSFFGGWPSAFYVFGVFGCIWYVLWTIFVYETPDIHPTIKESERLKIKENSSTLNNDVIVPWKSIATSIPVWAGVVTNFGELFGYYVLMTEIPTYLSSILHFNIKFSGFISSLPYISEVIGGLIGSLIADKLISTEKYRPTTIRKIFNSIAGYSTVISLVCVTFSECKSILIVFLLTFGMFLNGNRYSGFTSSVVDMTPNFAGLIYGLTNGIGNISGVIAPTMVGKIIASGATVGNWSKVFFITASVQFITTTIYAVFGTAERQSWGVLKQESQKEEKQRTY